MLGRIFHWSNFVFGPNCPITKVLDFLSNPVKTEETAKIFIKWSTMAVVTFKLLNAGFPNKHPCVLNYFYFHSFQI